MKNTISTLATMKKGESAKITGVGDDFARIQALRFGIAEGAHIRCIAKVPAGPIVLRCGHQEIAVGRELARKIHVSAVK